ncbi:hypothetical protein [Methylomagnum sp.]
MLRFLRSIFESHPNPDDALLEEVLKNAIERAVDKTDHRLRALGNYGKRLRGPVEHALRHVNGLIGQLPPPVEISPDRYGHDPRLRAIFASAAHMTDVLGRFQTVREYLEQRPGLPPDNIYGLLSTAKKEKRTLGMELDGDLLKRDVLQTAISFEDHHFLASSDSEESARTELAGLGFDFLLQNAVEKIAAQRLRRGELARTRQILRRKLLSSKPGTLDVATLEADIALIDEELGHFGGIELSLTESLQHVEAVLNDADQWLALAPFRASLDYRNVKNASSETLEMSEVTSLSGIQRIVLFGYIPRSQLPARKDMLKLGRAYLG